MMNSEVPSQFEEETGHFAGLKRGLITAGAVVAMLFLAGFGAGYAAGALERGLPDAVELAVFGGVATLVIAIAWGLRRYLSKAPQEPEAPRIKRARQLFYAMGAIGGVLGALLAVGNKGGLDVFSNGPVDPVVAIAAMAIFLLFVPVATWLWWKSIDEHEAGAYRDGSTIAIHAYYFIVPTWWLASRAGFVPAQDPMLVLLIVTVIWGAAWLARRYL
jgi:hypothetical protein